MNQLATRPAGPARPWRALFVSDELASPPVSGYRRRTAQCLRLVADVAEVDWVAAPRRPGLARGTPTPAEDAPGSPVPGTHPVLATVPSHHPLATGLRWAVRDLPWPLAAADWSRADDLLRRSGGYHYDLVWAMGVDACLAVRRAGIHGWSTVIDTDLESAKLESRLHAAPRPASVPAALRAAIGRVDLRRWRKLEQRVAVDVDAVCVPSHDEAERLGPRARVLPNTYEQPPHVWPDTTGPEPASRIVFVGSLSYPPNVEGLCFLADAVYPLLVQSVPDVRLQVVGRGLPAGHRIRHLPGVEVLDHVADVGEVLHGAALSVVPVAWGGGTRIKIIEAFAHRVPVVSTAIGAAGLEVRDGEHILLADTPAAFAAACRRLLADPGQAARQAEAAHELFRTRYEAAAVHREAVAWLRSLVAARARPTVL